MTVVLAVSYGGRDEITDAVRRLARKVKKGAIEPDAITQDVFRRHLATKDIPDPDLLVRTSGEMRVSNFFLWQLAYTEIYVTETLWPDFREREFEEALGFFEQRQRRFGRTPSQVEREAALRAATS
jgi:undecaprenyl diphosphate synthase